MNAITCKFGGSSLADAARIRRMGEILDANPERRYIVPSAPGKRHDKDIKITDLLYTWYNLAQQGLDPTQPKNIIAERYQGLADELNIRFDAAAQLEAIEAEGLMQVTPDFMASRGEYLNGMLVAEFLDATFVDPKDYIKFDDEGRLNKKSYELLGERLKGSGRFVVPGFYGSRPDGRIKTFSRGGSDITGAIVARATQSTLYENWTDVSGFLMADPRIVPHAERIEEITYKELRELSYMGAKVLHDEAIFPVREPGIPINIRNTNDPENRGTMILPSREVTKPVCGIAGRGGFTMVNIEKTLMNTERGFGRKVLAVLEEHDINFEHMPTGIDTISLIIRDEELGDAGPAVVREIERVCEPDRIALSKRIAIIATVGQGMVHHIGTAARLCTALANAAINLIVIDQGSSELNIIVGVDEHELEEAIRAIHDEFAQ